jgi:sulfite oxidase
MTGMPPFGKRAGTIVHELDPFNAEPSPGVLAESSLTPQDAFYARSHGAVPPTPENWSLEIGGLVEAPLRLTLDELRGGRFRERDVVATLQCAGNRRRGLIEVRAIPGEAPWGPGATGTAAWRGVALADVLAAAGVRAEARHVAFVGSDRSEEAKPPQRFGASIPIEKALGEEVILAWSMNDAELPALHGAPLRAIVPGYIGARSVKWLGTVELRATPFDGYFQDVVYRLLAPEEEPGPGRGMALGEVALNAEVLVPDDGAEVPAGRTEVRGYAFAGGARHVARVDVSLDGGGSWIQAELLDDLGRWAWRLWRLELELAAGRHEIVARAWDSAAASQPEHAASLWNPKGYVNNAWGRATVTAR